MGGLSGGKKRVSIIRRDGVEQHYWISSHIKEEKPKPKKFFVPKVTDGDTFQIRPPLYDRFYVRIADVDTPEKGHPKYYEEKKFLESLILRKYVSIHFLKVKRTRILADVYLDRVNIGDKIRERGY